MQQSQKRSVDVHRDVSKKVKHLPQTQYPPQKNHRQKIYDIPTSLVLLNKGSVAMKSRNTSLPEPLADETLSSWLWRVNSSAHIPFLSQERFNSLDGMIVTRDNRAINGEWFADRDLLSENEFVESFKKTFDIGQPWLNKRFPGFNRPAIPSQFRRAFCSQCFIDSFRKVGIPVCKLQWCYLTKPLCDLHGIPLHDSSILFEDFDDYTVQAFVSYWDKNKFKEGCDKMREVGRLRHGLTFKVQRRLDKLTRLAAKSGESFKVQMFLLTLMRAMMMPALHHGYPRFAFEYWGGDEGYASPSVHGNFYQEIYRSTCMARLYALYFSAIMLGWITRDQASKTLHENYYAPFCKDSIWSLLDESGILLGLLISELKLYETPHLNLAGLYIPKLVRLCYDV